MSKVLIIDDDATMSELLNSAFGNEGFEVLVAREGLQGTKLAHEQKPDMILLDMIMPMGGGEAVLRNLKLSTHTKDIPIIVISGTNDAVLIEQIKAMDVAAFFTKPFEVKDIILKVKELVGE